MKLGLTISFLLLFSVSALAESDPLFSRMEGKWLGEGTRTQAISGSKTDLRIRSSSVLEGDRLVSSSEITELAPLKTYTRTYWIRFSPHSTICMVNTARAYDLGVGSGDAEKILSHGCFSNDLFEVEQVLGTEPPFVVYSMTHFESLDVSDYDEHTRQGERELSQTLIRYKRQD